MIVSQIESKKKKVLILGSVWPEPTSSAAGVRMMAFIRFFQNTMDADVLFISASKENHFTEELRKLGIRCQAFEANDPRFDEWLLAACPDWVFFDRFILEEQFGWRVRQMLPAAIRILDTEDLHSLRRARESALKNGASLEMIFKNQISLLGDDLCRELASIYRSDLTLVISDYELKILTEDFQVSKDLLFLTRMYYPSHLLNEGARTLLRFDQRKNYVWIGNFRHPPNADALPWICERIWLQIRKEEPSAEFHIYGAYPLKSLEGLHQPKTGIFLKGPCGDAWKTLESYRVSLCPLRFGAGIKGKIADSWMVGTPVVTTPIGSEGMTTDEFPFAGLVGWNERELAEMALKLYQDQNCFEEMQARTLRSVVGLFDENRQFETLKMALLQLETQLVGSRAQNTVGQVLWHSTLRSTEYFSRWIEVKNQLKSKLEKLE